MFTVPLIDCFPTRQSHSPIQKRQLAFHYVLRLWAPSSVHMLSKHFAWQPEDGGGFPGAIARIILHFLLPTRATELKWLRCRKKSSPEATFHTRIVSDLFSPVSPLCILSLRDLLQKVLSNN